ncbi:unnamed protein product [Rhizopus stolonifer]
MSIEKLTESFERVRFDSSISLPQKKSKNRNPQCIPSDDDSSEDEVIVKKQDNNKKDNETSEDYFLTKRSSKKPSRAPMQSMLRQTRSDGITYSLGTFRASSAEDLSRIRTPDEDNEIIGQHLLGQDPFYSYQPQKKSQPQIRVSGMDLLLQREKEMAKRQKAKSGPGKIKIEGLLGKLPEPGTHNISFQQLQLEQQQSLKKNKQKQQQQQQMLDYGRASSMMYNPTAAYYQLPNIPTSNGSLYMNYTPPNHSGMMPTNNRQTSGSSIPFV